MDVVLGIIEKGGKILLIKRVKTDRGILWAAPGGKVDSGETLEDATLREVLEETGITCKINYLLCTREIPVGTLHYFICDYVSGEIVADDSGVLECGWYSPDKVIERFTSDIHPKFLEFLNSVK